MERLQKKSRLSGTTPTWNLEYLNGLFEIIQMDKKLSVRLDILCNYLLYIRRYIFSHLLKISIKK